MRVCGEGEIMRRGEIMGGERSNIMRVGGGGEIMGGGREKD